MRATLIHSEASTPNDLHSKVAPPLTITELGTKFPLREPLEDTLNKV
jgi:hypothetical protein